MGGDDKKDKLKILQVSNISVTASKDQIFTMFQYIGRIEELKVYPSDANLTSTTTQKIAFVKYDDERAVEVGQHLTNTVLIDRAIVCAPWLQSVIPDENSFMNSGGPTTAGQRQLPPHVINKTQEVEDGSSVLLTVDPNLEKLGLPSYPPLPGNTDHAKVEEIRRTVYVGNLPKGVDGQAVLDFFNGYVGEVMYVRMATGPDTLPCAYAYVEFSQQTSVPIALQNNGIDFQGRQLRIQHSRVAIIKPQQKTADQALEEVEEAIRMGKSGSDKRSRSRSPRRRRSPSVRRRSRSRERRDRRSRSRDRKKSRSRERKRSRSRERRSRRSRSRERRERSRSRDKKRERSKSRDRKKEKERKEKDRKRSRSRDRKKDSRRDRSSDRSRRDKDKDKKEKEKEKEKKKDDLDEGTLRERLLEKAAARSGKDGSGSDMEVDGDKKTPSKIKNERKRRHSNSDEE